MIIDTDDYNQTPEYRDLILRFVGLVNAREHAGFHLARAKVILAEFYRAPLSMASVQPILDLAVELNPELKENK